MQRDNEGWSDTSSTGVAVVAPDKRFEAVGGLRIVDVGGKEGKVKVAHCGHKRYSRETSK